MNSAPRSNLAPDSQPWGRDVERRLLALEQHRASDATRIENTSVGVQGSLTVSGTAASLAVTAQDTATTAQTTALGAVDTAQTATSVAGVAQVTAESKNTVTYATSAPVGPNTVNDTWFNTADGNRIYRWDGATWVSTQFGTNAVQDQAISSPQLALAVLGSISDAASAASAAQSAANSANTAAGAAQSTADTANSNASAAATAAANAAGIASGKADVLIQSAAPSAAMQKATTLWIDTTGGANTPKQWSGSAWTVVTDKIATDAASAAATAKSTADTANSNASAAATAAANAQTTANTANDSATAAGLAASNAQASANSKNTVTYATSGPIGPNKTGDTWFNTADGNRIYRWSGSAWVAAQLGTNAITDLSVTNAKIADATIASAKIAALDAGKITTGTLASARIAAGTITATQLAAGAIDGTTITGATLQTGATGQRVVIDGSDKIALYAGIGSETPASIIATTSTGVAGDQQLTITGGTNPITLPASGAPKINITLTQQPDGSWISNLNLLGDSIHIGGTASSKVFLPAALTIGGQTYVRPTSGTVSGATDANGYFPLTNHNLGVTPSNFSLTVPAQANDTLSFLVAPILWSKNATQFQLRIARKDGAGWLGGNPVTIYWTALP